MSESLHSSNEKLLEMQSAVDKAVEVVAELGSDPLEVFPNPADKERRADVVWGEDLTNEEQDAFRAVMSELGPGREDNVGPEEAGINSNYVALFEGGLAHKMIAQLNVIDTEGVIPPSEYVVSGSTGRQISDSEKQIVASLLGIDPSEVSNTEHDLAEQVVMMRDDFVPTATLGGVDTEQYSYRQIGYLNGVPVDSLGIKRTPRDDGGYNQLSNQHKIELVQGIYGSKVAFVTSATYQPSVTLAALKATENTDKEAYVLTYGTKELAEVKGTDLVEPSIAQLGAEAHKTAKLLQSV